MVTVTLSSVTGQQHVLSLEPRVLADDVYAAASKALKQPPDKFSLVLHGSALQPGTAVVRLREADALLAAPRRRTPSAALLAAVRESAGVAPPGDEDVDPDAPLYFSLPADAPAWHRRLAQLLQQRLRMPDVALVWLFHLGPGRLVGLALVLVGARVAAALDLGPLYVLAAILVAIFTHLGSRREGEASAYSVFNEGVRRLPGQLDADALDEQIRRGNMM